MSAFSEARAVCAKLRETAANVCESTNSHTCARFKTKVPANLPKISDVMLRRHAWLTSDNSHHLLRKTMQSKTPIRLLGVLALSVLPAISNAQPTQPNATDKALAAPASVSSDPAHADTAARVIDVGLSDRQTQLILPWFLEDLKRTINDGGRLDDYLDNLRRGA